MQKKTICVVGLGYIGLPTAALLSNRGYQVYGVDVVQNVVDTINKGQIHIVEPELDIYVKAAVNTRRLVADTKPKEADVFIIAVPTPFHEGYVPNIDYVISATKSIVPYVREGNVVILESTSPVGTTEKIEEILRTSGIDTTKIYIAHCPERVLPGKIMKELVENDRIVGGLTPEATKVVAEFYREFVQGEVLETDAKTAEMAKLTENSFRDVNIAFANELSILCDKFGINVWELIRLANKHPRVNILQPGAGVGGHCIGVDPYYLTHKAASLGFHPEIMLAGRRINDSMGQFIAQKVIKLMIKNDIKIYGANVLVLGITFKENCPDIRNSKVIDIIKELKDFHCNVDVYDPWAEKDEVKHEYGLDLQTQLNDKSYDAIVLAVAHKQFKELDIIKFAHQSTVIYDVKGVLPLNVITDRL